MSELADNISRQVAALDASRLPWESLWEELAEVCHPRRATIQNPNRDRTTTPDRSMLATTFDGTAQRANGTLAAGQSARITPMGARWFVLRPPAEMENNPSAQAYYHRATEILANKLGTSNFYNRAHECYLDRGAFGISALEAVSGAGGRGLHFRALPVGTYSIAQNALDEVDTIAHSYRFTPAQILQAFPDAELPEAITKAYDNPETRFTQPHDIVRLIVPRTDRDPRRSDSKNKPFASYHLHKATNTILAESGFDEIPIAVSRWATWGDSPYGWAPSYAALPEASQLNYLEEMLDTLAERAAFPPVLIPAGMKDDIDFAAMGITTFDPNNPAAVPREWLTGGRYDVGKDRSEDKRRAIKEAFFVELFNAISHLDPNATATHISAIVSESRELFHPIYSNMVREFLTPVLRRSFAILVRSGEIPPPPPEIIQQDDLGAYLADPEVEYVSAMALALEQSHLTSLADIFAVTSPLAQLDPTVFDSIDPRALIPHFFRAKGLPSILLRTPQQLEELNASRAAQAEQQQALAATEAVRNLGGAQEAMTAAQSLPTQ
jgi:hypothetical protein